MPISTVTLVNTFDQWRIRTNESITVLNNYLDDGVRDASYTYRNLTANVVTSNVVNSNTISSNTLYANTIFVSNATILNVNTIVLIANIITSNSVNTINLVVNQINANSILLTANNMNVDQAIRSSYIQANTGRDHANGAFLTANAAFSAQNVTSDVANASYDQANTARLHANGAFLTANAAFGAQNVTSAVANASYDQANTARVHANGAFLTANLGFNTANAAFGAQNVTSGVANAAYNQANTARVHANGAFGQANVTAAIANAAFNRGNTAVLKTGNTMTGNLVFSGANITFFASASDGSTLGRGFSNLGIYFSNTAGPGIESAIYSNSANIIVFATKKTERVRIDDAGRLNIGTIDIVQFATAAFAIANAATTTGDGGLAAAISAYNAQNVTSGVANAAYNQANTARVHANGAFLTANAALAIGSAAYDQANTARTHANAAFAQANTANTTAIAGFDAANTKVAKSGDTLTGDLTFTSASNQLLLKVTDGAIEITRSAGGAYIDFKDSTAEDVDVRLTYSGTNLQKILSGGATSTIWDSGNDGAGSGLDADLLDGQQGSYYAPLSSPTFTGTVTIPTLSVTTGATIVSPTITGTSNTAGAAVLSQTLTDGVTVTWDIPKGQIATLTLGGNRTMAAPTNLKVGTFVLHVIQDATGGRTITWNSIFKWTQGVAPTLSTAVGARDVFSFVCDGTNLYGAMIPDVR